VTPARFQSARCPPWAEAPPVIGRTSARPAGGSAVTLHRFTACVEAESYRAVEVAAVEVLCDGGVLSLAADGVLEAWLSFVASMMTVLVLVDVRPDWSVTTY
jgi:hypothetical protein